MAATARTLDIVTARRACRTALVGVLLCAAALLARPAAASLGASDGIPDIWVDGPHCAGEPACRDRIEIVGADFTGAPIWLSFSRAGTGTVETQSYITPQVVDGSYGFYFVTDLYDCSRDACGGYGYEVVAYDTFLKRYANTLWIVACEPLT